VHITKQTYLALKSGKFEVEPGEGHLRDSVLADNKVETFLIIPPSKRVSYPSKFFIA